MFIEIPDKIRLKYFADFYTQIMKTLPKNQDISLPKIEFVIDLYNAQLLIAKGAYCDETKEKD